MPGHSFRPLYREVSAGIVLENSRFEDNCFPTDHHERPCFGYVFETRGRQGVRVVFTGDTGHMPELAQIAEDARDCLVFQRPILRLARRLFATKVGHLTATQAAQIAAAARVKCLLLNHLSCRNTDALSSILTSARLLFPNILIPEDLDQFRVSPNKACFVFARDQPKAAGFIRCYTDYWLSSAFSLSVALGRNGFHHFQVMFAELGCHGRC